MNPASGAVIESFPEFSPDIVDEILLKSASAFDEWRTIPFSERTRVMMNAASLLRTRAIELAETVTHEMGKPISQSKAEMEKCALVCEYYASTAEHTLAPESVRSDASKSFVRFDPLGVVLAVMPWNFPFWQVFRFAAPTLMAGNTAVLKHSSNVSRCAMLIEEIFAGAGFPADCFRTLLISSGEVAAVIRHPAIAAVTLTGSDAAGRSVAAIAGGMLKKTVLELGGSDPFIILKDADLDDASRAGAQARLVNSGQSCIAAKRFIVEEAVADVFEERFVEAMARAGVGDPMDPGTEVGPLAREDLLRELEAQVARSVERGARMLLGGKRLDRKGFFFEPTVLANVSKGMPVYDDEVFGPVAAVIRVADEESAVRVANDSRFGLGASVWTADTARAESIATRLEAGSVFVNGIVKSDPRLPFGGVKLSGYGRELGAYGIKEFVNIKTVWVK